MLAQLGKLAGGIDYVAVAQAVSRFDKRLLQEKELRRSINKLSDKMSKVLSDPNGFSDRFKHDPPRVPAHFWAALSVQEGYKQADP